jgi:DNA-binding beta-propeller fold protein YncE
MTAVACLVLFASLAVPALAEQKPAGRHRFITADTKIGRVAIINKQNKIEWETHVDQIHDIHVLPNGNILYQSHFTNVQEITPDKKIVWEYKTEGKNQVHGFQRLANGNTMVAESGTTRILEIDPKGKIVHETPMTVSEPHVHRDTRLVRALDNGHYLVCHESEGKVREYNRKGKIVWEFDIPMGGPETKGHEGTGNKVYGAIRLKNGNTLIATGNGHSVLEVTPEKKVIWAIYENDLPGIRLQWVTTLQRLPNGNTVIGNCHAGEENPQIIEVNPAKEVVWTFHDFERFGNDMTVSQILDVKGESIR